MNSTFGRQLSSRVEKPSMLTPWIEPRKEATWFLFKLFQNRVSLIVRKLLFGYFWKISWYHHCMSSISMHAVRFPSRSEHQYHQSFRIRRRANYQIRNSFRSGNSDKYSCLVFPSWLRVAKSYFVFLCIEQCFSIIKNRIGFYEGLWPTPGQCQDFAMSWSCLVRGAKVKKYFTWAEWWSCGWTDGWLKAIENKIIIIDFIFVIS